VDAAAWGGAKSVAIARGPASKDEEELRYLKSVALQTWLFGYEVPGARCASLSLVLRVLSSRHAARRTTFADTVMLFTPNALHIVASAKKGVASHKTRALLSCLTELAFATSSRCFASRSRASEAGSRH
jgi:nucleosome binding factor SPN SPT16 subunit